MAIPRLRSVLHHLRPTATANLRLRAMSSTVHNTNEACCSRPPVESNYTPKGSFISYGNFDKVYSTGPPSRGDAVLVCVYDIFGFHPLTQQGADILASQLKLQVLMPDFFGDGAAWSLDNFPPVTPEQKQELQKFFGGVANPVKNADRLVQFGEALKKDGVKKVGCYGFCWGGKVIMLAGGHTGTPFDAISIVHPAMLSADDAPKLNIPLGLYPSLEEPEDQFHKIVDILNKKPFAAKNDAKIFKSFHGFAAARGNLDDPDNKAKYEDLYQTLVKFFTNNDVILAP